LLKLLQRCSKLPRMNNLNDPKNKDTLNNTQVALVATLAFLDGTAKGELADEGTSHLIAESAKAIAATMNSLVNWTKDVADQLVLAKKTN